MTLAMAPASAVQDAPPPQIQCAYGPLVIFFDRNAIALDDQAKQTLELAKSIFADELCGMPGETVEIGAYLTPGEPSPIAEARLDNVRNYLISRGMPEGRLAIRNYGSRLPRLRNPKMAQARENRRVEITLRP